MRRVLLLLTLLTLSLPIAAQSVYGDDVKADVKMKYVYSFEEAIDKAKREKKPIFFNCFADWVLTCHGMNIHVFSNQEFADWCDDKFVNLFIDVSKEEGKVFAEKYDIVTFAQYLILDEKGEILQRIIGGDSIPAFKEKLSRSLDEKTTYRYLDKRYEEGHRDTKTLKNYATALYYAGESMRAKLVAEEYFAKTKRAKWSSDDNWYLFQRLAYDANSELFANLIEEKDRYIKEMGEDAINKFISQVYSMVLLPYTTSGKYDKGELVDFMLTLKNANLPENDIVFDLYNVVKLRANDNLKGLTEYVATHGGKWDVNIPYMINLSLPQIQGLSESDKDLIETHLLSEAKKVNVQAASKYKQVVDIMRNTAGVKFEKITFKEALAKAKSSGKLIFLDCYTTWCGPCIQMSTHVFTKQGVGNFFNANFINLKMDMEAGEGVTVAKRYGVTSFPTLMLIDGNGDVVHKIIGGRSAADLVKEMGEGLKKYRE